MFNLPQTRRLPPVLPPSPPQPVETTNTIFTLPPPVSPRSWRPATPRVELPQLNLLMIGSLVLSSLLHYTSNHKDIHCLISRDLAAWQSIIIIRTGHKTGI